MSRLNITAKIWLSIGVFVLGFVLATLLGQLQGLSTEKTMSITSAALFPAAQQSQEADTSFQRMCKGFSDAVMTMDVSGIDRAAKDGEQASKSLRMIETVPGLSPARSVEAGKLAASVEAFLRDAKEVYGTMLNNSGGMPEDTQTKVRELATRTDTIKAALLAAKEQFSKDLRDQLQIVEERSAQQRWLALAVFFMTLLIAGTIVNLTIRRAITGPILRVVRGVQEAADGAARASDQVAQSGQVVAQDAQEQAACIEETSSSLEEISITTEQNAGRAAEADRLMREGRKTVEQAAHAMDDLTCSMDAICDSSKQVAAVLKSIDEIAFYTNILALNAAVEAARAGEAGAGFSVVADEVRSLAQRAAEAARSSGEIVQKTIADVEKGVSLVSLAHESFKHVSAAISGSSEVVSQIASSSREQARGVTHIGEAISRMEAVTQNNASNATQMADSASAMSQQVEATRRHIKELASVVGVR